MENDKIRLRFAKPCDINELVKIKIMFEKEERRFAPKNDFWRMYINPKIQKKDISEDLRSKDSAFIIAENNSKKILGFITTFMEYDFQNNPRCKIAELFVLPEYRGRGIAKLLIDKVYYTSKINQFILHVSPNNSLAIAIYKKKGFSLLYECLGKRNITPKVITDSKAYLKNYAKLSRTEKEYLMRNAPEVYKRLCNRNTIIFIKDKMDKFVGFIIALLTNLPPIMKVRTICKIEQIFSSKSDPSLYRKMLNKLFATMGPKTKYFTFHNYKNDLKLLRLIKSEGFGISYLCYYHNNSSKAKI